MADLPSYSPFFSCVYDEAAPVGHLGRGAHYSVLRTAEWFDVDRSPVDEAQIHDFAVIWDEDHDGRVIDVIEHIYLAGLLSPVQFIGERKGTLTVILASRFYHGQSENVLKEYKARISSIADLEPDGDVWAADFGSFHRNCYEAPHTDPANIIVAEDNRVVLYLNNIDSLWQLGTKPYKHHLHKPSPAPSLPNALF